MFDKHKGKEIDAKEYARTTACTDARGKSWRLTENPSA
jgi:hypothetical protein